MKFRLSVIKFFVFSHEFYWLPSKIVKTHVGMLVNLVWDYSNVKNSFVDPCDVRVA